MARLLDLAPNRRFGRLGISYAVPKIVLAHLLSVWEDGLLACLSWFLWLNVLRPRLSRCLLCFFRVSLPLCLLHIPQRRCLLNLLYLLGLRLLVHELRSFWLRLDSACSSLAHWGASKSEKQLTFVSVSQPKDSQELGLLWTARTTQREV